MQKYFKYLFMALILLFTASWSTAQDFNVSTGTTTIVIQENKIGFQNVEGKIGNNNSGFTGDGFANTDNSAGKGINWKVSFGASDSYTFKWRFANATSDRPAKLLINGSAVASNISFASTGSWTNWNEVSVEVNVSAGVQDVRLEAENSGGLANIDYIEITGINPIPVSGETPVLTVDAGSLSFGDVVTGQVSTLSYTLTGANLTGNVIINASSPFTISETNGGSYNSSLTLIPSNGTISQKVYVKFSPGATGSYSESIVNSADGASNAVVAVSGSGVDSLPPALSLDPASLNFGNTLINSSSILSCTLKGSNLAPVSGNVEVTVTGGFEVSASSVSGFSSSLSLPYSDGAAAQTIYVRFAPAEQKSYTGNISISGGGASVKAEVSGKGTTTSSILPKHWHETAGFGTTTKGGLGKTVYKVTNLNNSGAGSFRDAVSGNDRLVVFEVGGVIDLDNSDVKVGSNVTVAGQTAPYPGISLIRANLSANGSNTVVSHITVLFGDDTKGNKDTANIKGNNIVFDHVAVYWSIDETLSIHGVENVTLYKCIIGESLQYSRHPDGEHSKASLINKGCKKLSLIGCLFLHNALRGPRVDQGEILIANQVNYNWTTGWDEPSPHWFDYVVHMYRGVKTTFMGNVAIQGPESKAEIYLDGHHGSSNSGYIKDNIIVDQVGNPLTEYDKDNFTLLDSPPIWNDGLQILPAHESVYETLRTAGPHPGNRNPQNARVVKTVADGNGEVIDSQKEVGGYPKYAATYRALTNIPTGAEAQQAWLDAFEDEVAVDKNLDLSRIYKMVGSANSDKLK